MLACACRGSLLLSSVLDPFRLRANSSPRASEFWQTSRDKSLTMQGMARLWVWKIKPLFLLVVTASRKLKAERRFFEPLEDGGRDDKTCRPLRLCLASSQNPHSLLLFSPRALIDTRLALLRFSARLKFKDSRHACHRAEQGMRLCFHSVYICLQFLLRRVRTWCWPS